MILSTIKALWNHKIKSIIIPWGSGMKFNSWSRTFNPPLFSPMSDFAIDGPFSIAEFKSPTEPEHILVIYKTYSCSWYIHIAFTSESIKRQSFQFFASKFIFLKPNTLNLSDKSFYFGLWITKSFNNF